jgi:hypothetical protein
VMMSPPVFPLKAGDIITYSQIGGRVSECEAGGGDVGNCDVVMKATYNIKAVERDANERWQITADVIYEPLKYAIKQPAIAQLVLENVGPFAQIGENESVTASDAVFTTDKPALHTNAFTSNNFPFFQMAVVEGDTVISDPSVFNEAAAAFNANFAGLDADANIQTQVAAGKMEAYFKDELSGAARMHKVIAQYVPMGIVCGWDEKLIPFVEGMQRDEADFTGGGNDNPPLVGSFFAPKITRDNEEYQCRCFLNSAGGQSGGSCRSMEGKCLSAANPDAEPADCPR